MEEYSAKVFWRLQTKGPQGKVFPGAALIDESSLFPTSVKELLIFSSHYPVKLMAHLRSPFVNRYAWAPIPFSWASTFREL